jgi:maltose alpha-D-glucosyltransferase/alpha-amylase
MVATGEYGYERVNVGTQRGDSGSLLNWLAALNRTRHECGEIGLGSWKLLETGSDAVFGVRYDIPDSSIVIFNNLTGKQKDVSLDLSDEELTTATDLFTDHSYEPLSAGQTRFRISAYGYRWMRIRGIY